MEALFSGRPDLRRLLAVCGKLYFDLVYVVIIAADCSRGRKSQAEEVEAPATDADATGARRLAGFFRIDRQIGRWISSRSFMITCYIPQGGLNQRAFDALASRGNIGCTGAGSWVTPVGADAAF